MPQSYHFTRPLAKSAAPETLAVGGSLETGPRARRRVALPDFLLGPRLTDLRPGEIAVATMHLAKGLEFRAVAVMAVLFYHAEYPWALGGFLGVETFFVLSGFLITSLLLSEWQSTNRINLKHFWLRRARRLLPAVWLLLLILPILAA